MTDKILQLYLLHFVHLPVVVIYSISTGEDIGTLGLITFIALLIVGIIYGYNVIVTLMTLRIIKDSKYYILGFLSPIILLIASKSLWNDAYNYLDFGNEGTKWYLIISALVVNIISYTIIAARTDIGKASP